MAVDIARRIEKMYPLLSKSHRKIANAVLHEYDKIEGITAHRLAKRVGVSESTVVRFTAVLGYEGYIPFQQAIKELIKVRLTPSQRIEMTKQRIGRGDLLDKVMHSDIDKIKYTLDNLDREAFQATVDAILNARRVFIIGARSAEPIARILYYNLSLVFDNIRFVTSSSSAEVLEQLVSITTFDVVIAFSFPRYSAKVVEGIKFAYLKGAITIALTDSYISPLVQYAKHTLIAQSDMASFMDSLVAPISIINAIIIQITRLREKRIVERFDALEKLWDEYDVYTKKLTEK